MSEGSAMLGFYDPAFVALSVFIAVLSAYAALDLAGRVTLSRTRAARLAWLGGGAVAMGIGIWSMHYIGMLAFRMQMPVLYDWPTVLLSLTAAIAASGIALYSVSRKTLSLATTFIGSLSMGGGVAAMHYIGMAAMRMPATRVYSMPLVGASIVLAVVIAFVALRLTFASRHVSLLFTWRKGLSALLMGFAIPVMHYLGMAAARFVPAPLNQADLRHAINISDLGAVSIALVTVVLLCLVFLSAIVDRQFSHQEKELEGSEERYRMIIDSTFDAFLGISPAGILTDWNAQACATFGWTVEEAMGRAATEMIEVGNSGNESLLSLLAAKADAPLQGRVEIIARHKSGIRFPAEMALSVIRMGENNLFAAFIHDVTERKAAERQMEEARQAAEAASRAKSEFLANMSHEIRTPLNGVIGMTDLALETELTREQREYLETVKLSADSLLSVINDILDFSKIEAGKVDLEDIRFDIRECLESTLKTLALRADEKNLELLCDINPDVPEAVFGDPGRLRQITTNLIGNALKFTSEGEVSLHLVTETTSGLGEQLHFTVSDTGIGIAPHKLETIFESFSQADTSTTRVYGGTGLGLTISRRLIDIMGGRIWIESELGKGSHFHFTVPLRKAEPFERSPEDTATSEILTGIRVLIIDDNKTNRRILEGLMRTWGLEPTSAADGPAALDLVAKACASGEHYRLILTDMHMPKMDGFTVVQEIIKSPEHSLANTTVMMLSSGGHRGDAARCQELGIAAYLLKPVRQVELRQAIVRALGGNTARGHSAMITQKSMRAEQAVSKSLNILLAEDNPVNQKLAVRLLEKRGHTVTVVDNGREAFNSVVRGPFDLVLMDVQMPEMDGITATMKIRLHEQTTGGHQPIVAMTALVMKGDRERCIAARMDGYLSKPIRPVELDEVLDGYMARKTSPTETEAASAEAKSAPSHESVNVTELLERIDGDIEFIAELSDIFRNDYPRQLQAVSACIRAGDAEGLKRAAHTLKGALANLSAIHASSIAADLEQIGDSGNLDQAQEDVDRLNEELPRVLTALDEVCREQVVS
ncbi:response regulator [Granulicella sibirica]|uniref:Sensory/regulatory protein RpfC n=1 Tax=Granulicella sibirica TaxID=2479048 RepID=A0A4Q0SXE0_9BACT|nr:response regulator [Granulicella sibirica]RXH54268.1 diguanylate cyclase/phosphodiesterase (GGDEF & EAL domains) with PAS/PAC sensor(s) [Granulicella sibirica]